MHRGVCSSGERILNKGRTIRIGIIIVRKAIYEEYKTRGTGFGEV